MPLNCGKIEMRWRYTDRLNFWHVGPACFAADFSSIGMQTFWQVGLAGRETMGNVQKRTYCVGGP